MEPSSLPPTASASRNADALRELFSNNESLIVREIAGSLDGDRALLLYLDVLVDEKTLDVHVVRNARERTSGTRGSALSADDVLSALRSTCRLETLSDLNAAVSFILDAGVAVFQDGVPDAFGFRLPGYVTRAVEEPQIEINVRGPREAFIEDLRTNLGLIFRRMKSPSLKMSTYVIGTHSSTKVALLYLDGRIDPAILEELQDKLSACRLEVLLANTQLEELLQESTFSPFPQIFNTERPDRVVVALNRGKAAILADGTPIALIAPTTFFEMLHPSEDLYERFYITNFLRVFRLITLFISLFGPSLYIALTTFHLEMIPTPLMMAFLTSKAGIPFPTFVEALVMEAAFEILREASLRLPRVVGQSVSIVGALIIGEAAVQSGIVSRPMVIVVAMTGIASFTNPSFSMALSLRMLRFPMMLFASYMGVLGISLGLLVLLLHLCSLQTLGVPFLDPVNPAGWKASLQNFVLLPVKFRTSATGRAKHDGNREN